MAEEKKVFAGMGKRVNDWKRGVSVCLDDIQNFAEKAKNGKFYVRLNIIDLKQANQWGKDVSVEVDTWKPDSTRKSTAKVIPPEEFEGSEIPF